MDNKIISPLLPDDFIEKVKVAAKDSKVNYRSFFQAEIKNAVQFAIGPYFWFIPDNTQSKIVAVSSNINTLTPHTEAEWLGGDVHLFANLLHPADQLYVLSSIQKAMEIFEEMPASKRKKVGLNIYGRLLNAQKNYVWRLIQFPGLYFNEDNRVESALLMISDLSHIGQIHNAMFTIIDNSSQEYQFYMIADHSKKLTRSVQIKISKREQQVIRLMANGLTSNQIAEELNLAFYTIENHKRNLREKTSTKSAAELINFVLVNNLL